MAHEIYWLKPGSVLFVSYKDYQTEETLRACLDEMAAEFDKADHPVVVLIDWRDVIDVDLKALLNMNGHRAYSHPMAARGVLVGMDRRVRMENEITAARTRETPNTKYCDTMDAALDYLQEMLGDDVDQAKLTALKAEKARKILDPSETPAQTAGH